MERLPKNIITIVAPEGFYVLSSVCISSNFGMNFRAPGCNFLSEQLFVIIE